MCHDCQEIAKNVWFWYNFNYLFNSSIYIEGTQTKTTKVKQKSML